MTREEEIKNYAYNNCINDDIDDTSYSLIIETAKWADETMIEKAEKWLGNFLEKTIQKPSINGGYTSDTIDLVEVKRHRLIEGVLYDFKKAMEL